MGLLFLVHRSDHKNVCKNLLQGVKMKFEFLQNEITAEQNENQIDEIPVSVPESLKASQYCNLAYAQFTNEEIQIDFLNMGTVASAVVSRIVMTPSHTKRLIALLDEKIAEYEERFGEVPFEVKQKDGK